MGKNLDKSEDHLTNRIRPSTAGMIFAGITLVAALSVVGIAGWLILRSPAWEIGALLLQRLLEK
jgi:hypothetical protein